MRRRGTSCSMRSSTGAKSRGLLSLPGEFGLIYPQRFLTLLCHGFPPVTEAVLLGSFLACASLALVLCSIRPPIPCPLTPRRPCFLAKLPAQLDVPSADSSPADFLYHLRAVCSWKASSAASLASTQLLLSAGTALNFST